MENSKSNKTKKKKIEFFNKIRTSLLIYSNNENQKYLKNCKVLLNSIEPHNIIKKYDVFEVKFENPTIHYNIKFSLGNKNSNSAEKKNLQDLKSLNLSNEKVNINIFEFFQNKKIICSSRKMKRLSEILIERGNIFDGNSNQFNEKHCINNLNFNSSNLTNFNSNNFQINQNYSFDKINQKNFKSNNLNTNSIISRSVIFKNFACKEELIKSRNIQKGFDKLQKLAHSLKIINSERSSMKDEHFKYEELLDILEFKELNTEKDIIKENLKKNLDENTLIDKKIKKSSFFNYELKFELNETNEVNSEKNLNFENFYFEKNIEFHKKTSNESQKKNSFNQNNLNNHPINDNYEEISTQYSALSSISIVKNSKNFVETLSPSKNFNDVKKENYGTHLRKKSEISSPTKYPYVSTTNMTSPKRKSSIISSKSNNKPPRMVKFSNNNLNNNNNSSNRIIQITGFQSPKVFSPRETDDIKKRIERKNLDLIPYNQSNFPASTKNMKNSKEKISFIPNKSKFTSNSDNLCGGKYSDYYNNYDAVKDFEEKNYKNNINFKSTYKENLNYKDHNLKYEGSEETIKKINILNRKIMENVSDNESQQKSSKKKAILPQICSYGIEDIKSNQDKEEFSNRENESSKYQFDSNFLKELIKVNSLQMNSTKNGNSLSKLNNKNKPIHYKSHEFMKNKNHNSDCNYTNNSLNNINSNNINVNTNNTQSGFITNEIKESEYSNLTSNSIFSNNLNEFNSNIYNNKSNINSNNGFSSVSFYEMNSEICGESDNILNINTNSNFISINKNADNNFNSELAFDSNVYKNHDKINEKYFANDDYNSELTKNSHLSDNSKTHSYITKSSCSDLEI